MWSDDCKVRIKKCDVNLFCAYFKAAKENHKMALIRIAGSWLESNQVPLYFKSDAPWTCCKVLPQEASKHCTHIYSISFNIFSPYGLVPELCNLTEDCQMVRNYFLIYLSLILTHIASESERYHISYVALVSWWSQVNLKSWGRALSDKYVHTPTPFSNRRHKVTVIRSLCRLTYSVSDWCSKNNWLFDLESGGLNGSVSWSVSEMQWSEN